MKILNVNVYDCVLACKVLRSPQTHILNYGRSSKARFSPGPCFCVCMCAHTGEVWVVYASCAGERRDLAVASLEWPYLSVVAGLSTETLSGQDLVSYLSHCVYSAQCVQ